MLKRVELFIGNLKLQPKRTFNGNLVKSEVVIIENLADDEFLSRAVHVYFPHLAIYEVAIDTRDLADVVAFTRVAVADLVALVAKALLHWNPEVACVDQLNLSATRFAFSIRQNPEISRDASVVEKLVWQSYDGFQPVVLDNPAPDFRFAAVGVAREKRGAVEDNANAAAAFLRLAHFRKHVLKKKQRTIIDARRARSEAALETQCVALLLDEALLLLPFHAQGRIGQHVIELLIRKTVFRERVAENDVIGVLAFDDHVGLADSPGVVIPVLAIEQRIRFAVELADIIFRNGEHSASAAGRIVNRFHHVTMREIFFRREKQIHHQLDHLARSEVFASLLIRLLCADSDQLLED